MLKWHYLAIVGPASIYNVKVDLMAELAELLERGRERALCFEMEQYLSRYLAIVGPALIINVKVILPAELTELAGGGNIILCRTKV